MKALKTFLAVSIAALSLPVLAAQTGGGIPRATDGHPDFTGIWQTTSAADYDLEPHVARKDAPPGPGIVEGGAIPYKPEVKAQRQRAFDKRQTEDPRLKCWILGVPRSVYYPEPFQILQRARDLTLVHQFGHQVRTIHTNGTLHPDKTDNEYWLGDSRGHWEGDTLVVDVKDFNDETWLDRSGNLHGTQLHVVERWTLVDKDTIDYRATLEDPEFYAKPWSIRVFLHRHREPNFQLIENYCYTLDYEQYYPPKKN